MLAPIVSIKHFVSRTNTGIASGNTSTLDIAVAVPAPATANTNEVNEGSVIKAIWNDMWLSCAVASGSTSQTVVTIEKIPAGAPNPTNTNMLNLSAYPNKRNILFTFQGNQNAQIDGAQPISPSRGWIKISKGKQRMALGDKWVLSIATVAAVLNTCGMFIYKEYR